MPCDSQRRAIDDASRLHDLSAITGLSAFQRASLEGLRLVAQRIGEVATAIERIGEER